MNLLIAIISNPTVMILRSANSHKQLMQILIMHKCGNEKSMY